MPQKPLELILARSLMSALSTPAFLKGAGYEVEANAPVTVSA